MEQSRQFAGGNTSQQAQKVIIAAQAPEKEMPRSPVSEIKRTGSHTEAEQETTRPRQEHEQWESAKDADAQLTIILKQIQAHFEKQSRSTDVEALAFSLRHLFSCVDFLYYEALPILERSARERESVSRDLLQRQQIWLQSQAINRTLDRMAPLCHLLSDVIEALLDTLENEENWLRPLDEVETLLLERVSLDQEKQPAHLNASPEKAEEFVESECWEKAINCLMDRLLVWQDQHHKLIPFHQHFASSLPAESGLSELDKAFAILIDSAGAIFGDILPNFRLVMPEDREEISALLFDLMQQSDQMLVQLESALEPLNRLIRHFAIIGENA